MSDALFDRLKAAFAALVGTLTARFDYGALYAATVKSQSADLSSVGVVFDDPRWPPADGVPIQLGIPGVSVKVSVGARVLVGFADQNPSKPRATLWEHGGLAELHIDPSLVTVFNGGAAEVSRVGDSVGIAAAASTWFTAVGTSTGAGTPPTTIGSITSGTSKVKA